MQTFHTQFATQRDYDKFHEKLETVKKAYTKGGKGKVKATAQETFSVLVKQFNYSPIRACIVIEQWRASTPALRKNKRRYLEDYTL